MIDLHCGCGGELLATGLVKPLSTPLWVFACDRCGRKASVGDDDPWWARRPRPDLGGGLRIAEWLRLESTVWVRPPSS